MVRFELPTALEPAPPARMMSRRPLYPWRKRANSLTRPVSECGFTKSGSARCCWDMTGFPEAGPLNGITTAWCWRLLGRTGPSEKQYQMPAKRASALGVPLMRKRPRLFASALRWCLRMVTRRIAPQPLLDTAALASAGSCAIACI